MTGSHVVEVTADTFQRLIEQSVETPVLLDFWAEWCGPCRTLGPVLEGLAADYGGGFILAKVDSDKQVEIAQAFQVQGIPFCVLISGGRPVDAFQGNLPEAEIRSFLESHGVTPAGEAEEPAEEPTEDPNSPEARLNRARQSAAAGDVAGTRAALEGFPEESDLFGQAERIGEGLEFLEVDLSGDGSEAGQALIAAREAFTQSQVDGALEHILESVAADKGFRGGLGRRAMLLCFALLGEDNEACDSYRRRLATLLY